MRNLWLVMLVAGCGSSNGNSGSSSHAVATATAMPYSEDDPRRRQKLLIGGVGGAALVCALALLFIFRPWQKPALPRLGGEPSSGG